MQLDSILTGVVGRDNADALFRMLNVAPALMADSAQIERAHIAQAMNMALFHDLLARVPSGRAYVAETLAAGGKVTFDHGALRTVAWCDNGTLPSGRIAITRVLEALGFAEAAIYPLPKLKMTGYAYRHLDYPEDIAQYFVSELHPEQFSAAFQSAVSNVLTTSVDPLSNDELTLFKRLANRDKLTIDDAITLVQAAVRCFNRHHQEPRISDYEILKAESAEMAWILTEGNAFNHATDRVADVVATAEAQRASGRAIKEKIEVSATGRVRQTALIADKIMRGFSDDKGERFEMEVPGSFYEFISRDLLPESNKLDLAFDTGNATGIFNVTAGR
jgi:Domain of unknown function (DUF1338)